MGAKTWMLAILEADAREVLAARPMLDRDAAARLAAELFPHEAQQALGDADLSSTNPPDEYLHIGCFPGVSIVAAIDFALDRPSELPPHFLQVAGSRTVVLHAMHSVVDWFAFAVWRDGKLERSLSLAPDNGIVENIGPPMAFELPFWNGEHPAVDPEDDDEDEPPYPFPFHPLELGEAALSEFFGYQLEGIFDATLLDPETVPLARYERIK
ncbi:MULTISPECIES: hypothetical protein [unclassified Rhizobacter]|uniref:DUF6928 family protein n=1 Tax=unclassified Rhizobacter TaxID=2640088 RepID=UPI0006F55D11|nr:MULTISPECIES: hypothetical protein [unclassified Rhizobacter]KQU81353.1 hypothetical protein ASC88_00210 [Rhizobacter sp. Root29]KQW09295.1 hypothetical protein ASC98_24170 [Rhizobacter sp. Root1238]KRB18123.1 hypothetical protein ASE08_24605 [Rhizobacter sp. Root16D2]